MIWASARATPDKIIVRDAETQMSWKQLLARATAYSNAIKASDRNDSAIIPILVGRTCESIAAILGCLIAGKAFSPISVDQPAARLKSCLVRMNAQFVLAESGPSTRGDVLVSELGVLEIGDGVFDEDVLTPPKFQDADLLYILFTSGSTGNPKGVMVDHGNIVNTLLWADEILDWTKEDTIGIAVNLYFDIAMFDIFLGLCSNIPIAILSEPGNIHRTCDEIRDMSITSLFSAPVFFSQFVRTNVLKAPQLASLRRIISGGDFFAPDHILRWRDQRPDVAIYNVWGPTETSIVNTMHCIEGGDLPRLRLGNTAPVGRASARMPFVLVDDKLRRVEKVGEKGEICMMGRCVTVGYLADSELTDNSYIGIDGARAFRTGDVGSLDETGNLSIHGRIGSLIKIAGHRIDVGEIEGAATSAPEVYAAAAFAQDIAVGLQELWLVIELEPACETIDMFAFKKFLKTLLPKYMVPRRIVVMDRLKLTANYKIDRRAIAAEFQTKT